MRVGIERMRAYPCSLALPMEALCEARGRSFAELRDSMGVDERSLNPPWEDPVTMAVNAALPMLTARDRESIGLLIVASESGVDQEKPMSTWVQRYLGLSSRTRNIEVKHACYGATAGLHLAASWVASSGDSALVINTDQARAHFGQPWEFVLGAGAIAMLVSPKPQLLEIEPGSGIYTNEVSDLTRPTSQVETGNSETSLLSYLDGLENAFDDLLARRPDAEDVERHFQRIVYHLPFAGMGRVAHRTLLRRLGRTRRAADDDFVQRTSASLAHARRMGGTYGASTFLALMSLLDTDDGIQTGDRIGMFSYGSGSCAEWWSGRVCPEAREVVRAAGLPALLDRRKRVTVEEYERVERARMEAIDAGDHATDRSLLGDWYASYYAATPHLIFEGTAEHYRRYAWST